jgi:hypothetical protein
VALGDPVVTALALSRAAAVSNPTGGDDKALPLLGGKFNNVMDQIDGGVSRISKTAGNIGRQIISAAMWMKSSFASIFGAMSHESTVRRRAALTAVLKTDNWKGRGPGHARMAFLLNHSPMYPALRAVARAANEAPFDVFEELNEQKVRWLGEIPNIPAFAQPIGSMEEGDVKEYEALADTILALHVYIHQMQSLIAYASHHRRLILDVAVVSGNGRPTKITTREPPSPTQSTMSYQHVMEEKKL